MVKVAINGFGRIGRLAFKRILEEYPELNIVAINDLTDPTTLGHLLKYDSLYGTYKKQVKAREGELLIDGVEKGKRVKVLAEKDPAKLPWKEMGVDIVVESTGRFTHLEGARKHIEAGARQVIISANSKTETTPHFIMGVNNEEYNPRNDKVVSMGSCTTNCLTPIAKVINDNFGIIKGFLTTVHSYTNDQRILDLPHKDLRRARAAGLNIIPTTTGAVKAVGRIIPQLKGKIDGIAMRVPTPSVSILDLICQVEKKTTAEDINYILKKASQKEELKGILGIEDALLVSSDYRRSSFSAIVDANLTMANGNLIKIVAWYDNEWAYACRLADFTNFIAKKLIS